MMSLDLRHKAVGGAKKRHYQGSISGGQGLYASSGLYSFIKLCASTGGHKSMSAWSIPK